MQVWLLGSLLLGNKLIDILHKLLSRIGTFLALYSDERVKGYSRCAVGRSIVNRDRTAGRYFETYDTRISSKGDTL